MNHLAKNAQTATISRKKTDAFLPIPTGFLQKLTPKNEANPRDSGKVRFDGEERIVGSRSV